MGSSVILPAPGQPGPLRAGEFTSGSTPAIVTFDFESVAPPSTLYIQRDDQLVIQAGSVNANEIVTVGLRLLEAPVPRGGQPEQGQPSAGVPDPRNTNVVSFFQERFILVNARVVNNILRALAEGYLLSVVVSCNTAQFRGQCFVRLWLQSGGLTATSQRQLLFSDYVTSVPSAGFPGGRISAPEEGPGFTRVLQISTPAAGADFVNTNIATQRFALKSLSATFTASAAVANRNVTITIDQGGNIVWADDLTASITAAQVISVNGSQTNVPTGLITTTLFFVLPPGLIMMPQWNIRSSTANIQAGDQWSNIWMNLEEYLVIV